MGAHGFFAVSTVWYFWYQLRPPPALVNLNPQRQAEGTAVADAAAPTATPVAAPAAAPGAIPGLPPSGAKAAAPVAAAPATPAPRVEPTAETPRLRPSQRVAEVQPAPAREPSSSVTRNAPQVSPKVEAGYAAYAAGDLAAARSEYEQALRDEPANRDALLGLAAIDVRA